MLRLLGLIAALLACVAAVPAEAMQFSLLNDGSAGRIVSARGVIGPGDAGRLARALSRASIDRHGTRTLWLDSPGGSVVDAMEMADVIGALGVTTVVRGKAMCASACASVVFVAGKYRRIDKGGQLLIHSCFDARNGEKMDECDLAISQRAAANGLSGRAMMAFQEVAPGPRYGVLFNAADAACFGLTRAPGKAELGDNAPCVRQVLHAARKKKQ